MINTAQPIYVVFSLEDLYEKMSYVVEEVGEYDFPFTITAFGEFAETIINAILMDGEVDCRASGIWLATLYVGYERSVDFFNEIFQDIRTQLSYFNVPLYPVPAYTNRFHMDGTLTVHLFHEPNATQPTPFHTRDDILLCIHNGDYISDKLKRDYGIQSN